jgi:hypothetical protein
MFGSSAAVPSKVTFDVTAADAATEIFLIDGDFNLAGKIIGKGSFSATPGLYKLKVRGGNTTVEKIITVSEGMKTIVLEPVKFTSPVPLTNTATTDAKHEDAVRQAIERPPDASAGSGSAIVIVVRVSPCSPLQVTPPANPARGLKVLSMDGTTLADLEALARFDPSSPVAIATINIAVAPGAYRLALDSDGRRIEQIVFASGGWQTQVYAFTGRDGRADLVNAAITIRKDFAPDDMGLRLEQIALAAFRDDRKILSDDVRARIADPVAPPVLALLGALLLIREAKNSKQEMEDKGEKGEHVDNRAAVAAIVTNLRAALKPDSHPDVEAIAIGAGKANPSYDFHGSPTMFRASWRLLLKASVANASLIAAQSFAARVGTRIWGDGPWLIYLASEDSMAAERVNAWQNNALDILSDVAQKEPPAPPSFFLKMRGLVTRRVRTPFPDPKLVAVRALDERVATDVGKIRAQLDDSKRRLLVKRLGVPMSSIDAWLDELHK